MRTRRDSEGFRPRRRAYNGAVVAGALVLLLVGGLLLLPLPCADDLFVDMGATADRCGAAHLSTQPDSHVPVSGESCCPCACHFGIATGPALAQLPAPLEAPLPALLVARSLDAVPSPITHPPLA